MRQNDFWPEHAEDILLNQISESISDFTKMNIITPHYIIVCVFIFLFYSIGK